jgi:hypothetical protein
MLRQNGGKNWPKCSADFCLGYFLCGFFSDKTVGLMQRRAELQVQTQKIFHANKNCLRKSVDDANSSFTVQQKQANRRVLLARIYEIKNIS